MLGAQGVSEFDLVGHSMGGLTALLLAEQQHLRVRHFVNIEGNIAPEDCFLSRQILQHQADDAGAFFADFITRTSASRYYASALYAAGLP